MGGRLVGGRYRLSAEIGRGGMGAVWRAHDELLDRPVALKEVLLPHWVSEEDRAQTFARVLREARAAARLRHSSVVTIFDVVEEEGRPWIAMELLPAESLEERIRRSGPLPEREVAEIGLRLLDALRVAHAAGIMHRDIKPANVLLLEDDDGVVLTDFGIAQIAGDPTLTASGMLVGSPGYMAPERLEGEKAGPPSDLWSLGGTLYTAVEGSAPFHRSEQVAVLAAVLTRPFQPMRLAAALRPLIEGLLRKDPAERMTHAEAKAELTAALAAAPPASPSGSGAAGPVSSGPVEYLTDGLAATTGSTGWPEHGPISLAERVAVGLLAVSGLLAATLAVLAAALPLSAAPLSLALFLGFLCVLVAITFVMGEILDPLVESLEWVYATAAVVAAAAAASIWPAGLQLPGLARIVFGALGVWLLLVALSTWQHSRLAALALGAAGVCFADLAVTGGATIEGIIGLALYAVWAAWAARRVLKGHHRLPPETP